MFLKVYHDFHVEDGFICDGDMWKENTEKR
jgi:hypothetical protein